MATKTQDLITIPMKIVLSASGIKLLIPDTETLFTKLFGSSRITPQNDYYTRYVDVEGISVNLDIKGPQYPQEGSEIASIKLDMSFIDVDYKRVRRSVKIKDRVIDREQLLVKLAELKDLYAKNHLVTIKKTMQCQSC